MTHVYDIIIYIDGIRIETHKPQSFRTRVIADEIEIDEAKKIIKTLENNGIMFESYITGHLITRNKPLWLKN